jgi:curli biogenesis system outer membrane secretion channel CsgG
MTPNPYEPSTPPGHPRSLAGAAAMGLLLTLLSGCASQVRDVAPPPEAPAAADPAAREPALAAGPKHRIAIASFEDKSGYGSNLFGTLDDLGKQASDILASHLIKSGQFVVLEREKLGDLKNENQLQGKEGSFVGVTALVFGSVTEFGTKTEHMDQGLSKSKVQTAHAKVTIRLVDPATGQSFYAEFGEADARKETSQVLGFGSSAGYDATLTDKALNGAITKLTGNVLNTLKGRPWQAPILDIQEGQIFVGAGSRANLKVGQTLAVMKPGKKIKNPSTGALIELPGTRTARLKVVSQFGTSELNEGSVCQVLEGTDVKPEYYVTLEGN